MKTALLLVLCFVLCCGLIEGNRSRGGHNRGGMQGRHSSGKPKQFKFNRMKKLFREHKRIIGNWRRPSRTGEEEASENERPMGRPGVRHPFRKIRACKAQCQDDCMDFHTCRETCQENCEDGKFDIFLCHTLTKKFVKQPNFS